MLRPIESFADTQRTSPKNRLLAAFLFCIVQGLGKTSQQFGLAFDKTAVALNDTGDQRQANLDPTSTPFETISAVDLKRNDEEIRSWLARFLFYDDSLERKISSLSGGERSRLMLARLILCGPNVLVLDEPTNHLDIPSRTALEGALADYPGTLITVSHDRFFLDRIATRIIALGSPTPQIFTGNYTTAMERLEQKRAEAVPAEAARKPKKNRGRGRNKTPKPKKRRTLEQIEGELAAAEGQREALLVEMAEPDVYGNPDRIAACQQELAVANQTIGQLEEEWDTLT